jgi:hypothetical protein
VKLKSLFTPTVFLYLIGVSLFVFPACTKQELAEKSPNFCFGSAVYITNGFFKGCRGHIVDFRRCFYIDNYSDICYSMDAMCTGSNGTYSVKKTLDFVHEEDLVEDDSN